MVGGSARKINDINPGIVGKKKEKRKKKGGGQRERERELIEMMLHADTTVLI